MPTLDLIHGRIASRLADALSDLLQDEVEVHTEACAPVKLAEFLSYQSSPACINLISFAPLLGTGLLCFPIDMFYALLDAVLGGEGADGSQQETSTNGRDFTAIERDFACKLTETWSASASEGWSEFHPVRPAYLGSENSPDLVNVGNASDVVITTTFQVKTSRLAGKIELAIPYASLDPIKHRLSEQHTDESAADRRRWRERLVGALLKVPVGMQVELGRVGFSVEDLLALRPGTLVRLDRHPATELDLRISGRPKARVMPLEVNGNLAFEFKEWRNNEH